MVWSLSNVKDQWKGSPETMISLYSDRNLWKRFMGRLTGAVIILLWLMDLKHRGFFEASLWGAKVKQKTRVMCRQRHLSPQHFNVFWRLTLPIALKPQISSLSKHLWTKYRQIHIQLRTNILLRASAGLPARFIKSSFVSHVMPTNFAEVCRFWM